VDPSDAQAIAPLDIFSGGRMTSGADTASGNLILWESACAEPIAARVAVAGDFLPAGDLALPAGGWREAARHLAGHFEDVATSFVNLESALDTENLPARPLCGIGQLISAPSASLDYLRAIRSRAVGLANNHSYDFRAAGVKGTRAALVRRGMIPLGAGHSLGGAPEVFLWQGPGDIRVGFWAAATASRDLATSRSAGAEPATIARASQAIRSLQSQGARCSIALLHAGCLRTNRPDPGEAALMDSIARCGFNIVAASHSHRISGSKILSAKRASPSFCFYGLGSIVSGYSASPLEREGLIVVAGFHSNGELAQVEVRPVWLSESGFGEVPSPETAKTILKRFRALSDEITNGSARRLFYQDVSQGLLRLYFRDVRAAFRWSGLRGLVRKAGRVRMRHVHRLVHSLVGRVSG
jgi:poly-gamma-glutamate capsule biosynthesis protein CapA/YwtB (metallophosphatase superfamily)